MKWIILFLLCFSVEAKLDLSKKQYIIHLKSPDRLMLKSGELNPINREVYEVHESVKDQFVEEMSVREDVVEIEENILLNYLNTEPLYLNQWAMQDMTGGIDVEQAWDLITTGNSEVVVAVIDSGILLDHQDFDGALLPGADFVSDTFMGNDGDGRDMDPSDPGNWNNAGECGSGSKAAVSNWHGSHVAGIVGARKNNYGVVGVAPDVSLLPVRAMGKCGGRLKDVADAIRWSAGGTVPGMPDNQNPAQVINLSLGGIGDCGTSMQQAIDYARSQGAVVIVAVGNDGFNLDFIPLVPVSCRGVINVASNNGNGAFSSFSNYGQEVDVTAPGGYDGGVSVLNVGNSGTTVPLTNQHSYKAGTSMSAPHVAGLAALIYSINPDLFPDQVEQLIKDGAYDIGAVGSGHGIMRAYESLVLADGMDPDPNFQTDEPTLSRRPFSSTPSFGESQQEEVAACGTVELHGPKSGGGFMPSLLMGLLLISLFQLRGRRLSFFGGELHIDN